MSGPNVANERIRDLIAEIEREIGILTAERLIAYVRQHPAHPLYGHFTWDDQVAAEERRLDQAHALLARRVTIKTGDGRPIKVAAFIAVGKDYGGETIYKPGDVALQNRIAAREALRKAVERAGRAIEDALNLAVGSGLSLPPEIDAAVKAYQRAVEALSG